jgi:hypothetical protein
VASFTIAVIMMLTVADVLMRYLFSRPITGTTELTEFMMVILILSVVPAALANRHITVNMCIGVLTPNCTLKRKSFKAPLYAETGDKEFANTVIDEHGKPPGLYNITMDHFTCFCGYEYLAKKLEQVEM